VTASGNAADNSPVPVDGFASLSYDTNTNRITNAAFQYDAAGNQTRAQAEDGSWLRFEYDTANRLSIVRRDSDGGALQAYQYSPSNGRLMNYDYLSGEFILYANNGEATLSEYHEYTANTPTWTKSYVYFGDGLLSTVTPNGTGGETTDFNHPDRLGTRTITNQSAGTSSEQATLPFGTALNAESTNTTNKNRFTSYDRSTRTGLDYAVNRNYDSKQGRFTQVDPIKMGAASLFAPQTLNLYTYCGNDPINHTDPSGLFWGFFKKLIKWVLVAVAVIVAVLTIVAAPATIAGILGAISAGANAASEVLTAAGFRKAGLIFGLIAVATGFGSVIAAKIGKGNTFLSSGGDSAVNSGWSRVSDGVGAVANSFRGNGENQSREGDDEATFSITFTAIFDAYTVLHKDLKCAKFFGLLNKKGKFSEAKFKQLKSEVDMQPKKRGPIAYTNGNKITLNGGFYTDGFFKVSPQPYSIKNPRQGRAQTILHELGHVKGLLISPDNYGYPNDPQSPANQNEKTIMDNCGKGLSQIPTS